MRRAWLLLAIAISAAASVSASGAGATATRPADSTAQSAAAATLTLVDVQATNTYSAANWVVDVASRTAVGTFPWGKGTYQYVVPTVIPPGGAKGTLIMNIEANQRWATGFSLSGDADFEPKAGIDESTDARGLVFRIEHSFTIKPRAYAAGTKTIDIVGSSYYNEGPSFTFRYSVAPASLGVRFKVDTKANDVRVGPPLVGWWQLCLSRLGGSGSLQSDGSLVSGGKLFQFNKCPKRRGGPRTFDASVMWQVISGKVTSKAVKLNFGTHEQTRRITARLVAEVVQTYDRKDCPLGTRAVITLRDDPRRLGNGEIRDTAEVNPAGSKCSHQGWSNADNPNNAPPRGGLGGGQHAQVELSDRS